MFWERFHSLCKSHNATPYAVCTLLGFSNATAAHWKKGSIPNGDALCNVADYFNCSVDYLLGRTDSPNIDKKEDISISEITINGKRYELSEK